MPTPRRHLMSNKDLSRPVAIMSLVLLLISAATARPRKMQRLGIGTWGGAHIRIQVNERSASVEYDCANGSIEGPLTLDSKGRFNWRGFHRREHGGPIRIDEKPNSTPATYTGWIKGDAMTVTVKLEGSDEPLGTFTLERGTRGRIFKCG